MKIGAAAWITAVSPESSRVSAKPSSQNGSALLSAPRMTREPMRARRADRPPRRRRRAGAARATPTTSRPSTTADGSSWSTPSLMKRNEEPQIADRHEQEDQVAAAHRPNANGGERSREVGPRSAGRGSRLDWLLGAVAEQPLHRLLGLTDGEFDRIRELLGREPNHFELAVFSLLWSEHCGYKHSALLLQATAERRASACCRGPGENAGVLDLGDGLAVAFKVESHNHPSAVEPFQGAATGVGGILRDISAMGARPIALLDGLRFGAPDHHFSRAVGGIGHYGNCVGVPTVGGEAVFDEAYARQLPRQRDVRRAAPGRSADAREGDRRRARWSSSTGRRPAATASAAPRCSRARSSARRRPRSDLRFRSATRSRARS